MVPHWARVYTIAALFVLLASAGLRAAEPVRLYAEENQDGDYDILADNSLQIPVWVSVNFPSLVNLTVEVSLPFQGPVPAGVKAHPLFTLKTKPGASRRSYRLVLSWAPGDPKTAQPDGYLYLLPFEHGAKRVVTQGFHGAFTHKDDNEYAVDFDVPVGTPVYAARGGTVIDVKEDSSRGGRSTAYARDGNYIMIAHEDGTFGNYVHLRLNGALVSQGDAVAAGDLIGYSGNTGVTSGPHLHFDVRVPTEQGTTQSIPFQFLNYDNTAATPVEGDWYYAVHPGKPDFPVVFGKDLTNESFASYSAQIPKTNKVRIRTEEIDSTVVFYLQNGYETPYEVTIDFKLQGMTLSREEPVKVTVPGLTEHYLLLAKPVPGTLQRSYSYSFSYRPAQVQR